MLYNFSQLDQDRHHHHHHHQADSNDDGNSSIINSRALQEQRELDAVCDVVFEKLTDISDKAIDTMLQRAWSSSPRQVIDPVHAETLANTVVSAALAVKSDAVRQHGCERAERFLVRDLVGKWSQALMTWLKRRDSYEMLVINANNNSSNRNRRNSSGTTTPAILAARTAVFETVATWLKWLGNFPYTLAGVFQRMSLTYSGVGSSSFVDAALVEAMFNQEKAALEDCLVGHICDFVRRARIDSAREVKFADCWRREIAMVETVCRFLRRTPKFNALAATIQSDIVPTYYPFSRLKLESVEEAKRWVAVQAAFEDVLGSALLGDGPRLQQRFQEEIGDQTKTLHKWLVRKTAVWIREKSKSGSKVHAAFALWPVMVTVGWFLG